MPSDASILRQGQGQQSGPSPGPLSLARARVIEKLAWRIRVAELVGHEDAGPLWAEIREACRADE